VEVIKFSGHQRGRSPDHKQNRVLFSEKIQMRNCSVPRARKLLLLLTEAFLIQALIGCQSQSHYYPTLPTRVEPSPPVQPALSAGDVVEIKFFYTPQLNEVQTLRPDGKISLQLVGEVDAQGKTPAELCAELMRLYSPNLRDPNVTVIVRSFYNRRVYVGGMVTKPGLVDMPAKLTALEAIIQAGGFDVRDAELRNVIVIRHKDDQRYGYSLNLKPFLTGGEIQPFYLEPQDILYVPRTEIAQANQWIDQHINKLIPLTGFIYSKNIGNGTVIGVDTSGNR
jgi:polysaccharide export outer membrane protein